MMKTTKKPPVIVDIHKKFGHEFTKYIGRALPYQGLDPRCRESSKWFNPFTLKKYGKESIILYEEYIRKKIRSNPQKYNLSELTGEILGCWCKETNADGICHGDVLIQLWNEKFPPMRDNEQEMIDLKETCYQCKAYLNGDCDIDLPRCMDFEKDDSYL